MTDWIAACHSRSRVSAGGSVKGRRSSHSGREGRPSHDPLSAATPELPGRSRFWHPSRGLSANPISTIGFERRHNTALQLDSEDAFVDALTRDIPPAPEEQAAIVAANRTGRPLAEVA
jgi:hypothetical protein